MNTLEVIHNKIKLRNFILRSREFFLCRGIALECPILIEIIKEVIMRFTKKQNFA